MKASAFYYDVYDPTKGMHRPVASYAVVKNIDGRIIALFKAFIPGSKAVYRTNYLRREVARFLDRIGALI